MAKPSENIIRLAALTNLWLECIYGPKTSSEDTGYKGPNPDASFVFGGLLATWRLLPDSDRQLLEDLGKPQEVTTNDPHP